MSHLTLRSSSGQFTTAVSQVPKFYTLFRTVVMGAWSNERLRVAQMAVTSLPNQDIAIFR